MIVKCATSKSEMTIINLKSKLGKSKYIHTVNAIRIYDTLGC
jgi:hypothetical protein